MSAGPQSTWQAAVVAAGREAGLDAVTDMTVGALAEALPELLEDPDLLEVARGSVAANVALAVELVQGTLSLRRLDPPPQAVVFARELARRNVPVAALDRAYRVGQQALWRWAVREVRARVDGDVAGAIEGLAEAMLRTGDVFSVTVMDRYASERERWLRSADALRAETLRAILDGSMVDLDEAGARLRYELRGRHEAFVVWTADEDAAGPGVSETSAARVAGARALVTTVAPGVVAGWAAAGSVSPDALRDGLRLALGSPGSGIDGFRTAHAQALEARRVARLSRSSAVVTRYADVALPALLSQDLEAAGRFVRDTLGRLAASDAVSVRLAETLHVALQEQGSPRRTAHRLGIHENTAAKRLRSIDELLGGADAPGTADLLAALVLLPLVRAPDRG